MVKQNIKLTKFEHEIMSALWEGGRLSIREILERFPEKRRPAYTTVQTIVYRLEQKGALRRVRKIGNAHIFEATITPEAARRRIIDDVLAYFGGEAAPLVSYLVESNKISADDLHFLEEKLKEDGERRQKPSTTAKKR